MGDKDLPSFIATETIDLNTLITRDLATSGSIDPKGSLTTSLAKLLQTIPLPTMLVDGSCTIIFANEALGKLCSRGKTLDFGSFASLFADPSGSADAESLIKEVFATRRPVVREAAMRMGRRRMVGRLHLRPLRVGRRRSVLVIVEDLTRENKELVADGKRQPKAQRGPGQLEKQLQLSTSQLKITTERLRQETAERRRVQKALDRLNEERVQEVEQRFIALFEGRKEPEGKKARGKRSALSERQDTRFVDLASAACLAAGSFRDLLRVVASVTGLALADLEAGDIAGARDQMEQILKNCRLAERATAALAGFGDPPGLLSEP